MPHVAGRARSPRGTGPGPLLGILLIRSPTSRPASCPGAVFLEAPKACALTALAVPAVLPLGRALPEDPWGHLLCSAGLATALRSDRHSGHRLRRAFPQLLAAPRRRAVPLTLCPVWVLSEALGSGSGAAAHVCAVRARLRAPVGHPRRWPPLTWAQRRTAPRLSHRSRQVRAWRAMRQARRPRRVLLKARLACPVAAPRVAAIFSRGSATWREARAPRSQRCATPSARVEVRGVAAGNAIHLASAPGGVLPEALQPSLPAAAVGRAIFARVRAARSPPPRPAKSLERSPQPFYARPPTGSLHGLNRRHGRASAQAKCEEPEPPGTAKVSC